MRYKNLDKTPSRGTTFFRPTTMSVAMSKAGVIPGTHMVKDKAKVCLLRQRNDNFNQRPSREVMF